MDAAQLVVEFATLFLGAFLAFGLENRRERRRLRRWARQYLGHLRDRAGVASDVDNIADDTQQLITSAEAWLQAREATELDDHVWAALATTRSVPSFASVQPARNAGPGLPRHRPCLHEFFR